MRIGKILQHFCLEIYWCSSRLFNTNLDELVQIKSLISNYIFKNKIFKGFIMLFYCLIL